MQLLDQQFFQKDEFLKIFSYYHSGQHFFSDLEQYHELQLLIYISQLVEMLQQTSQQSKLKTSQTNISCLTLEHNVLLVKNI